MCFTAGPKMENEMLSQRFSTPLKSVDPSAIRDGSAPVLRTDEDAHADAFEPSKAYNHAFLNRPRAGDAIETRFWMEYINGQSLDGKIRVLLRGDGEQQWTLAEELDKDANGLRHLLTRPDLKSGSHSESTFLTPTGY